MTIILNEKKQSRCQSSILYDIAHNLNSRPISTLKTGQDALQAERYAAGTHAGRAGSVVDGGRGVGAVSEPGWDGEELEGEDGDGVDVRDGLWRAHGLCECDWISEDGRRDALRRHWIKGRNITRLASGNGARTAA